MWEREREIDWDPPNLVLRNYLYFSSVIRNNGRIYSDVYLIYVQYSHRHVKPTNKFESVRGVWADMSDTSQNIMLCLYV